MIGRLGCDPPGGCWRNLLTGETATCTLHASPPTCATCRFMGAEDGISIWDDAADDGNGDTRTTPHHPCARIIHGNGGGRDAGVAAEPAIVTFGSGYAARLRVLPTFSCSLHEVKA